MADKESTGNIVNAANPTVEPNKGGVIELARQAGSLILQANPIEPHHVRLVADIRYRIASGVWPPGSRLPSTDKLVEQYKPMLQGGSRSTVRRALGELLATGELRGHKGVAVYVADPQPPRPE